MATPAEKWKPTNGISLADDEQVDFMVTTKQNLSEVYTIDKVLGQGFFGTTRLVTHKVTNKTWACKSVAKRRLSTPKDLDNIRREIQIMKHLAGNANICQINEVFEDKNHIHMILELCSGGELFERIMKKTHYSEKDAATIMRQMCEAMAYMHSMGVVHRDIKPENVLLADKTDDANIKQIDFGLSTWFRDGLDLYETVGTPYYVAPEVLQRRYNKEADVWSCGVMLYVLLSGSPPFLGNNAEEVFLKILYADMDTSSPPWDKISDAAKDCVRRMLVKDPKKRATVAELLKHPWMVKNGVASREPLKIEVIERMKKFCNMNRFKKEAVRIMTHHLSPDDVAGMKEMFKNMDTDNDGYLTVNDFRSGLKRRGASVAEREIAKLIFTVDIDGDNAVDLSEFLAATVNMQVVEQEEHLIKAFEHFDTDHSGRISKDELREALKSLHDQSLDIEKIIAEIDADQDGEVNYEEFCTMMRTQQQEKIHHANDLMRGQIPDELVDAVSDPNTTKNQVRIGRLRQLGLGQGPLTPKQGPSPQTTRRALPDSPVSTQTSVRSRGLDDGAGLPPVRIYHKTLSVNRARGPGVAVVAIATPRTPSPNRNGGEPAVPRVASNKQAPGTMHLPPINKTHYEAVPPRTPSPRRYPNTGLPPGTPGDRALPHYMTATRSSQARTTSA